MDKKNIAFAKEYLKLRPDYKEALTEIKMNVAALGVSDDEFNAALSSYLAEKKRYRDYSTAIKPVMKNALLFVPSFLLLSITLFLVWIYLASAQDRKLSILSKAQEIVTNNYPASQTGESI